jgi:hypothetical protein
MKNYFKALAGFQQECPVLLKDTSGYGYKYVDLPKIIHTINPLMKKHGLGFTQKTGTNPETNNPSLTTMLFHISSGEYDSSTVDIPFVEMKGQNAYQSFGSGLTYFRRYALTSALGIVSDKDIDAYGEQVTTTEAPKIIKTPRHVKVDIGENEWDEVLLKVKGRLDRGDKWDDVIKALKKKFNVSVSELNKIKKEVK